MNHSPSFAIPATDFDLQFQTMRNEIMSSIQAVLEKGDLILREPVREFEERFAKFIGTRYAVGVSNGTDALRLALLACGVGPEDEVITVAHTFVATVSSIVQVGARPLLVDVGMDFTMDLDRLEGAITPRTKALIAVHLNGRMCQMEDLMDITNRHGVTVIEDAAQAVGAAFQNRRAGSWGRVSCFSFFPGKILGALGDAGAVTTDDEDLYEKLLLLRDHGRKNRVDLSGWGYNCRLDALQAAVLTVKLERVPVWIARRREIAVRYHEGLCELTPLTLPPPPTSPPNPYFDVFQSYVIRCRERDALQSELRRQGIETLVYWPKPLHRQEGLSLPPFYLPQTEAVSRTVLSLPLYVHLTDQAIDYVLDRAHHYYRSPHNARPR